MTTRVLLCAVLLAPLLGGALEAQGQRLTAVCAADCNRDCEVTVDELLVTVNVALEAAAASTCDSGDVDGDGDVTVDEIISGVRKALTMCGGPPCERRVVNVEPSEDDQETVLTALLTAQPGDDIVFAEGTYHLTGQLSLDVDDVTLRGAGIDKTIFSFAGQQTGAEGLLVTANRLVLEDLALEDSRGDLVKVRGAKGLTIRRVRTEWTGGPKTTNGAYGLYPVECEGVLIEDSIVRGASDAGFYIGQSHKIIMRRNLAEFNVAGIEIENSTDADVYENVATHNTGGIMVFNLPGLEFIDGRRTRVFHNMLVDNNTPNFAARGTTVSAVPTGTGVMILANDQVEVFENTFRDNDTSQLLVISFKAAALIGGLSSNDRRYDKFSEGLFIHDNVYEGGGTNPEPAVLEAVGPIVGGAPLPQILYDGDTDRAKFVNGKLPDALRLCVQELGVTFWNIDLIGLGFQASPDLSRFDCVHEPLPPISIPGMDAEPPPPTDTPGPTPTPTAPPSVETQCRTSSGNGVNVDPADTACQFLSSYRFFVGPGRDQVPNERVVPFDLNTTLFSDYTEKHRFVWLPPGSSARYDAHAAFDFPVGTVLIKTFAYPADQRDPSQGAEILETRLLVHRADGWVGLPYVWNADKSDAVLKITGATLSVSGIQGNGELGTFEYSVPNTNQCKGCHREDDATMGPIGPKARHLNKLYAYDDGAANQLVRWAALGILTGAPADPMAAPRAAVFDNPATGSLDARARAYLDVNCAHCHNPLGAARPTGVYYDSAQTDLGRLGVCKSPTAAGRGTGDFARVIEPGRPDESILTFRMRSIEPEIAMPELGRRRVHGEAVDIISDWIASLTATCDQP